MAQANGDTSRDGYRAALERAEKLLRERGDRISELEVALRLSQGVVAALTAELGRRWHGIESAPRDGRAVLLLSKAHTVTFSPEAEMEPVYHPARCHIGCWNPEGNSWTDALGGFEGEICTWWNEVTHWMPLPGSPKDE